MDIPPGSLPSSSYCSFLGGFYFLFTCLYFIFTWHVSYFIYRVNPVLHIHRIACLILKMKYRKHAISFKCTDMFLSKKNCRIKQIQLWFIQFILYNCGFYNWCEYSRQDKREEEKKTILTWIIEYVKYVDGSIFHSRYLPT